MFAKGDVPFFLFFLTNSVTRCWKISPFWRHFKGQNFLGLKIRPFNWRLLCYLKKCFFYCKISFNIGFEVSYLVCFRYFVLKTFGWLFLAKLVTWAKEISKTRSHCWIETFDQYLSFISSRKKEGKIKKVFTSSIWLNFAMIWEKDVLKVLTILNSCI